MAVVKRYTIEDQQAIAESRREVREALNRVKKTAPAKPASRKTKAKAEE